MIVLARGTKQVKSLRQIIEGLPPKSGTKAPRVSLERYTAERFKKKDKFLKENSRLAARRREVILGNISKDDSRLKQLSNERKALIEQRNRQKIERPKPLEIEERVIIGSIQRIAVPPYDDAWSWQSSTGTQAQANKGTGACDLAVQSFGAGGRGVAAGVASWFFAAQDNPMQRFAAIVQYSYDWWDDADLYVAHNDLTTKIGIWGFTENRWVMTSGVSPGWSDGVGWEESHGQNDSDSVPIETFFPATANNWYSAWIWSNASVFADRGGFFFSDSSIQFHSVIPYVVFGSL